MYNEPIMALMMNPTKNEGKRDLGSELVKLSSLPLLIPSNFNNLISILFVNRYGPYTTSIWNDDCNWLFNNRKANEFEKLEKPRVCGFEGSTIYEAVMLCGRTVLHMLLQKSGTKPTTLFQTSLMPSQIKKIKERKETIEKENRKKAMAVFMAWSSQLDVPDNV